MLVDDLRSIGLSDAAQSKFGIITASLPATESLKNTLSRVLPYWESRIVPELRANKDVLIVAHGNSLRALVKMLDMMSESDIVEFNIPTGIPMLYELDEQLQPLGRRFLGRRHADFRVGARAQPLGDIDSQLDAPLGLGEGELL